jgi:capsular exopolysaccharide synthesis family protein
MNDYSPRDPELRTDRNLIPRADYLPDHALSSLDSDDGSPRDQSSLMAYLHALRRRWFLAFSLGLIAAAGAAAAMWMVNRDHFTATFVFNVSPSDESIVYDNLRSAGGTDFQIFKTSQQQYLTLDWVLVAALRPEAVSMLPSVQQQISRGMDPVRWLARELRVTFPNNGAVMNLSLTADSPDDAAWLVASVSKAYLDEVVNREVLQRKQRFDETGKTLENLQSDINLKRGQLERLSQNLGTSNAQAVWAQKKSAEDRWGLFQSKLLETQVEVETLKADLTTKQSVLSQAQEVDADGMRALVTDLDLESVITSDLQSADLKAQAAAIQEALRQLRTHGMPSQLAKKEQQHTDKLKEIDSQLAARRTELELKLRRAAVTYLTSEVTQLQNELAAKSAIEKKWIAEEERARKEMEKFGGSSAEIEKLKEEIATLDQFAKPLVEQKQKLGVELARPPRVTRITKVKSDQDEKMTADEKLTLDEMVEAVKPRGPDPSSQLSKTIVAALAALCGVVGLVLFVEVKSKRVNSSLDVSRSLGLQVIGAVPIIPAAAVARSGNSARLRRWRMLLNESMRGVMVRLLHEAQAGQSQVVMVSSACAGEGKSTLASNLAVAMARAGYRTLLVDFDLRRPSLGDLFDLPTTPGVSEVLRSEIELDDSINTLETDNLWVLTAGHWSPQHVSVLANGDTASLFAELRERYQFVVVDGSPILGVAEAQLICRHADTVLLSVLRDVSSAPKIMAACETLAAFGVRSLYAVVTGASRSDYGQYYGDYAYTHEETAE